MPVTMTTPNQGADENAVTALEARLGNRLPESYRAFLLQYNGGRPEPNLFKITEQRHGGVHTFFGLLTRANDTDIDALRLQMKHRVPARCLPIALAEGGNLVLLSLRDFDRGAVYFWDHELEADEGEPPTENNLFRVAGSFEQFWQELRRFSPEDVHLDMKRVKSAWIDPDLLKDLNAE